MNLVDVSMDFKAGQTYAITGKSGAGKTTLIDLLFRFNEIHSGSILVKKNSIKDWDVSQLRTSIAYVNQDTCLFNCIVYDNLTLGDLSILKDDVHAIARRICIRDFIMSLPNGYDTVLGDRGSLLSGGQKQCISIVRALLRKRTMLVLDEATSALDITLESRILTEVRNIMKEGILVIISHN